jgi:hypothetical protein
MIKFVRDLHEDELEQDSDQQHRNRAGASSWESDPEAEDSPVLQDHSNDEHGLRTICEDLLDAAISGTDLNDIRLNARNVVRSRNECLASTLRELHEGCEFVDRQYKDFIRKRTETGDMSDWAFCDEMFDVPVMRTVDEIENALTLAKCPGWD